MNTSRGPLIIAIVLLLMPLLYVGSYLALVQPAGVWRRIRIRGVDSICVEHYRIGRVRLAYWPLEQIDRKLRPNSWELDSRNEVLGGVQHGSVYYTP